MCADLVNPFNWSRSRAQTFNECKRKYYLRYYGHWGGWESSADKVTRLAYRLGKMTNMPMLVGSSVHESLARHFRGCRNGQFKPLDPQEPVRSMRRVWKDGLDERWRVNPKKYPPLFELYYDRIPPDEKLRELAEKAVNAISSVVQLDLYQGLTGLKHEDYLWVDTAGGRFSGSTIFEVVDYKAISNPDLVVRLGDRALIIDWKTGRPRDPDRLQLTADVLWAEQRLGKKFSQCEACLVYLADSRVENFTLSKDSLEGLKKNIREDMEEMSRYLLDREHNIPLDREYFPPHNDHKKCWYCQFQQICLPEMEAGDYI